MKENGITLALLVVLFGAGAIVWIMGEGQGNMDGWNRGHFNTCAGLAQEIEHIEKFHACRDYLANVADILAATGKPK